MIHKSILSTFSLMIGFCLFLKTERSKILSNSVNDCKSEVKCYHSKSDSTYISGLFVECDTKIPVVGGTFGIDKKIVGADEKGRFKKVLKPGKYEFVAATIGYYTKKLNLQLRKGDSLSVVIYLDRDIRPLH